MVVYHHVRGQHLRMAQGFRWETFQAQQRFRNCEELLAKVSSQGTLAIERAQRFAGATNITIPMKCQLALL